MDLFSILDKPIEDVLKPVYKVNGKWKIGKKKVKMFDNAKNIAEKTDNSIEKWFDEGGYPLIQKKTEGYRMPMGYSKLLTDRSYRIWIRYLRWAWCQKHTNFVKQQNKYYNNKRETEKPYISVCKKCGKEFNAPRNYYKICPECRLKPSAHQIKMQERAERKKEKIDTIKEVQLWYKSGITQEVLALDFGVSQKTISNWVNKKIVEM